MIKDLLISFRDNFKSKTSNPFFGTLILVWLTKNWNLIYSILNFDENYTLEDKRNFIIKHFITRPFIETLWLCVFEAFVILLISYFLVNLSRLIINFYEKRITPLVYKWTEENSIVLKSVYDNSENERKRLEKKVEEERDVRLKLQEEYDKLEKRLSELLIQKDKVVVSEQIEENKNTTIKNDTKRLNNGESKIDLILNKLKKEKKLDNFKKVTTSILNNNAIRKSEEIISELLTMGIITQGIHESAPDWYKFKLTPLGQSLHEKLLLEELK